VKFTTFSKDSLVTLTDGGMAVYVAHMGEMKNLYKILVFKFERKIPLGRFRCIMEENMTLDIREVGWKLRN
jgi:hypothetical protein